MTKKTIAVLIVFILIVLIANNLHAINIRHYIPVWYKEVPWYQVEDWEKQVCSKWGGTTFAGQAAVTTGRKISFGAMSATVQGKRTKTAEKQYVYDVGWYIESFAELTDYEIVMINPDKPELRHLIDAGSLGPETGTMSYETYELEDEYTNIKFTYTGGSVTIPIIEATKLK